VLWAEGHLQQTPQLLWLLQLLLLVLALSFQSLLVVVVVVPAPPKGSAPLECRMAVLQHSQAASQYCCLQEGLSRASVHLQGLGWWAPGCSPP
jgi:hypothetical protein